MRLDYPAVAEEARARIAGCLLDHETIIRRIGKKWGPFGLSAREVDQGAEKRLGELRNGAWQRYIDNYITTSLTPFLRNSLMQQIVSLQEVFEVPCPKWKSHHFPTHE
jgi:hypothetical protein